MSQTENIEEFQGDPKILEDLKWDLLATAFNETYNRLLLLQQAVRRKAAKRDKCKKIQSTSKGIDSKEPMPPEEVLNDIKFDREIDALKNIYKIGFEALTMEKFNEENPLQEMLKAIEDLNDTSNEIDILANELKENKATLKQLKEQQVQQEKEAAEKLAQKKQRVQELRDELEKTKRINQLELKLVQRWEANRLSQAEIVGEIDERCLMQQILEINRKIAGEQRINNEIETFRSQEISELKQQIREWEEKFEREKKEKTAANLELSKKIAEIVRKHEKYAEIMEERKIFVAEYKKQKAEEQRLYEEQCYRIKCAIRIQAWWRGVMVRRGLGPYRKKSKKGKKSKAKK